MTSIDEQLYNHLKTLNKQWFYDKSEMESGVIAKSNTSGILKNDGTVDTNTYLTEHQDISGKIDSESLSDVALSGDYTDLENIPSTFTPSSHTHSSDELSDNTAYTNLETDANDTQDVINTAIDSKIGTLLNVNLIEVTDNKGTASSSTMNKLYLTPESTSEHNDSYEIFVTVRTGTTGNYSYTWEKVDKARINLTGYSLDTHVHGNLTRDGKIGTNSDNFITTGTGGLLTNSASIGNITTDGSIGSASGKVAVTTTNGVVTVADFAVKLDSLITDLITEGTPVVVEHITNPKILILNADGSPVNQTYTVIIARESDEQYQSPADVKTVVSNSFGEIAITDNWAADDGTPNGTFYDSSYYGYVKVNNETLSKVEYYHNDEYVKEFTDSSDDYIRIEFDGGGNYFLKNEGDAIYLYLDNGE